MKTITFNSKDYKIKANTLEELILELNITDLKGSAFAINGEVVKEEFFKTKKIEDLDQILLITAAQGG